MKAETRSCKNCEKDFIIRAADFDFYKRIDVLPPSSCFDCRTQQRMLFRNERTFYRRQCDLCKKNIIASYPVNAPHPVYCVKCWWSDNWDGYVYGREYDFSRPFFDQFKDLLAVTPAISLMNDDGVASTNSEYMYDWFYSKNCYMTLVGWYSENCTHLYQGEACKDSVDSTHSKECELMYECVLSRKLSRCAYCTNCRESQDCYFCYDLQGCSNCVLSYGLRNKNYCIRNKQYSKEEYLKLIKEMDLGSRAAAEKYNQELAKNILAFPRRYANIFKSVDTTGDFLFNCKNSKDAFFGENYENSSYIVIADTIKDCYDCNMTGRAELCYQGNVADHSYGSIATCWCIKSKYVRYSQYCPSAEWCFGCVGLKKGSYSILNRKYSKEEYEALTLKIIDQMKKSGEWGQFFPAYLSPYAYNESAAQDWFPLTKETAVNRGFIWKEPDTKSYQITMQPTDLPDRIDQVSDDILQQVISCAHAGSCNQLCTTAFKVTLQELQLHQRLNMPLPILCPNCRHYERLKRRNQPQLFRRQCVCSIDKHTHSSMQCPNEFETTYAPDRPEIVYCESCYQQEVV